MAAHDSTGGETSAQRERRQERLKELSELRERVVQLEVEVVELRKRNVRLSTLTDAAAEALLPTGMRDDARLRDLMARFAADE
jgi:undecaprenyl pyrophosphate synthase